MSDNSTDKIYIAGHTGMVGSSIFRELSKIEELNILTTNRARLDLTNQSQVREFFKTEKPDQVYLCAARVGGIQANNTYPAEFIYENSMIQMNVIHQAWKSGVKKLIFLGSSCIYPRLAEQPIKEEELMTGLLEPTNEPYAVAKISGIKLCESYNRQYGKSFGVDYRSVMPTNLYGPGDNYHLQNSHVIPGLIRRFHQAKTNNLDCVKVWGTGEARREFLFVEDLAKATILVMNLDLKTYQQYTEPMCNHINIGSGKDLTIKELANLIAKVTGFQGEISFDHEKPDGTPKKMLDSSKFFALSGTNLPLSLEEGLQITYKDFLNNLDNLVRE